MTPLLATAIGVAVGTVATAFAALTVVGVVLLVRRARTQRSAPLPGRTDAGSALVRADDAVRDAADDLAFAVAQFGEERTRQFATALDAARRDLRRAFELQHRLDDVTPEGERRARELARQIRTLADRARTSVVAEAARFEQLRRAEAAAPETLALLERSLTELEERRRGAETTIADLRERFVDAAVAPVAGNLAEADAAIGTASAAIRSARESLGSRQVTAVTGSLDEAHRAIRTGTAFLDGIEHRRDELDAAIRGIEELAAAQRPALDSARSMREAPPDPDSAGAVNDAIAVLEDRLAALPKRGRRDPVAELDALVEASDDLDVALAAARNQQRRLEGARSALTGALVSARTQIGAVEDYIGSHGGSAGARTRLAEAKRELLFAEHEADPVAALDAARRAQTHARDADALARY